MFDAHAECEACGQRDVGVCLFSDCPHWELTATPGERETAARQTAGSKKTKTRGWLGPLPQDYSQHRRLGKP